MVRTMIVSALFRQFGSCFGLIMTLQNKHNIHILSIYVSIPTRKNIIIFNPDEINSTCTGK